MTVRTYMHVFVYLCIFVICTFYKCITCKKIQIYFHPWYISWIAFNTVRSSSLPFHSSGSFHPSSWETIRSCANDNITGWRNNTFHLCREIWISSFSIPRRVKQTPIYVKHKYFIFSLHYYSFFLFQQSFSFLFFSIQRFCFLLPFPRTISLFASTVIKYHGLKLCQKKKKNCDFFIQRSTCSSGYVFLGIS